MRFFVAIFCYVSDQKLPKLTFHLVSFYVRKTHSFIPPPHRHSSTRFLVWSFFPLGFSFSLSFFVLCLIYSSRVPWPSLFSLLTWWLQRWPLEKEEIEIRNMPLLPPPPRIARCNSKQGGRIPKLQTYIFFKKKSKNDSLTRALIFCTSHVFKKVLIKKWVFYSSDTPNPFQKELQCSRMIDFKGPAERKGCLSFSSCSPNRRREENIKISSPLLFLFFLPSPRYKPDGKDGWERNPVFPPLPLYFYQFQFPLKKSFPPPVIIAIIIIIVVHWRHTREERGYENQEEEEGKVGGSPFFHRHTDRKWREGFAEYFNIVLGKEKKHSTHSIFELF